MREARPKSPRTREGYTLANGLGEEGLGGVRKMFWSLMSPWIMGVQVVGRVWGWDLE